MGGAVIAEGVDCKTFSVQGIVGVLGAVADWVGFLHKVAIWVIVEGGNVSSFVEHCLEAVDGVVRVFFAVSFGVFRFGEVVVWVIDVAGFGL